MKITMTVELQNVQGNTYLRVFEVPPTCLWHSCDDISFRHDDTDLQLAANLSAKL